MSSNFTLLHDEAVECFGYKFYGTAWQPEFGDWAFGLGRGEACRAAFEAIPEDTDVLVTHTWAASTCFTAWRTSNQNTTSLDTSTKATLSQQVR